MTDSSAEFGYTSECPCGARSSVCASSELGERWFIAHVRAQHPEHLADARAGLLAGAGAPHHVEVDADGDAIAQCNACGERFRGPADADDPHRAVVADLHAHWRALHSP
jgi:hypothetical protein